MKFSPYELRKGIDNAKVAINYFMNILEERELTDFEHKALALNYSRIERFAPMLTASKWFKYL